MPAPPGSVPASPRMADRPAVEDEDPRPTPVRSVGLGVDAVGADRSIRSVAASLCVAGPLLPTASWTLRALSERRTVPWLQPVRVTDHVVPAPVGVPIVQPVAVPLRTKSGVASPWTA